jgi:hypothetical protein
MHAHTDPFADTLRLPALGDTQPIELVELELDDTESQWFADGHVLDGAQPATAERGELPARCKTARGAMFAVFAASISWAVLTLVV